MRQFGMLPGRSWHEGALRALRGNAVAQVVLAFLMSAEISTYTGIFRVTLGHIADATGHSREDVEAAIKLCAAKGELQYDDAQELVFVHGNITAVYPDGLQAGDNRVKGLQNELAYFGQHPFVSDFVQRYGANYCLTTQAPAASNPPPQADPVKTAKPPAKTASPARKIKQEQAPAKPLGENNNDMESREGEKEINPPTTVVGAAPVPPSSGKGPGASPSEPEQAQVEQLWGLWQKVHERTSAMDDKRRSAMTQALRQYGLTRAAWIVQGSAANKFLLKGNRSGLPMIEPRHIFGAAAEYVEAMEAQGKLLLPAPFVAEPEQTPADAPAEAPSAAAPPAVPITWLAPVIRALSAGEVPPAPPEGVTFEMLRAEPLASHYAKRFLGRGNRRYFDMTFPQEEMDAVFLKMLGLDGASAAEGEKVAATG
jgi:hypothetical protein